MDNQRSLLLNWAHFHQEKSMDELRQSYLLTMELEDTRIKAEEELKMRDEQILQLKELLNRAIKERDEAQEKCQKLFFEKLLLQQSAPHSGISSIDHDEHRRGIDSNSGPISSSDCDESIVSSPAEAAEQELPITVKMPLPEKGKLLQAVMKAGPLLQTLLLAGPLPQWRHPPPPLEAYQIPPPPVVVPPTAALSGAQSLNQLEPFHSVNNCGRINRKRGLSDGCDSSMDQLKYQRVVLQ